MTPSLPDVSRGRKLLRNFLLTSLIVMCWHLPGRAQTAAPAVAFEVATIKPSAPLDPAAMAAAMRAGKMPRLGELIEGDRADYRYMTMKELIATAFRVQPYQVEGPEWLGQARFDITAKLPAGAAKADAPQMLEHLLADRFKLAVHPQTEDRPVLGLVVGKSGPKMKEAPPTAPIDENTPLQPGEMKMDSVDGPMRVKINNDGSTTINMGVNGVITQKMNAATQTLQLQANSISMPGFARMLTKLMSAGGTGGKQVVDMTGLKGNYSLSIELSLADLMAMMQHAGINMPPSAPAAAGATDGLASASDPVGGSTIYGSVQALGLKLEPRNAQVTKLVVDHVDKTPTEN